MKILIISPHYFPNINPRAHRWTSIAEHWATKGHEIHLVTSRHDSYNRKHKLNKVNVYRTGFNSLKEILYYFSTNISKRGEAQQKQKHQGKKGAFLQWVNDKILRKVYFPDDAFTWYFPARRTAQKLIKNYNFDLLITVSIPFTAHIIGLSLKQKNTKLKWIADTGDPFAFQPLHPLNNYFFYGKWNRRLEEKVVTNADFVTLTNKGAQKLYEGIFPKQKEKFEAIPPLYSTPKYTQFVVNRQESIKLAYFGSFFKKIREPRQMLKFWDQFLKEYPKFKTSLELHFYGNIFENFLKDFADFPNLKQHIYIHGLITKKDVAYEMQNIDFLLNVGNATPFQLPSKSVDYLASGKPIINFCSIREDTFYNFIKNKSPIINVFELEMKMVREFLEGERDKGKNKTIDMRKFSPVVIGNSYMDLVCNTRS